MPHPHNHHIELDQPAPFSYPTRTIDLHAGKGYPPNRAYVALSYDDNNGAVRLYLSPEDARALALKALGAAMDAEHIIEQATAGTPAA